MPDRIHGDVFRCATCGLLLPGRVLDATMLGELYRSSTHEYGDMEPFIRSTYMRYVRRALMHLNTARPRACIDIGCCNGFMLPVLEEAGFDAFGIEPSADAAAKADPRIRSRILQGVASPELLPPNRYDMITCFQTLDHLPDPVSFVKLCFQALRPGGIVLFINHDARSWTARLLGERSPIIDIEHTYLPTQHTMRMLFERSGFTGISVFSVRNDYPLWYWLHLLPVPAKKWLLRGLKRSHLGSVVLPLYAGNLGLIARKPL